MTQWLCHNLCVTINVNDLRVGDAHHWEPQWTWMHWKQTIGWLEAINDVLWLESVESRSECQTAKGVTRRHWRNQWFAIAFNDFTPCLWTVAEEWRLGAKHRTKDLIVYKTNSLFTRLTTNDLIMKSIEPRTQLMSSDITELWIANRLQYSVNVCKSMQSIFNWFDAKFSFILLFL